MKTEKEIREKIKELHKEAKEWKGTEYETLAQEKADLLLWVIGGWKNKKEEEEEDE